jgi:hypothetical protein
MKTFAKIALVVFGLVVAGLIVLYVTNPLWFLENITRPLIVNPEKLGTPVLVLSIVFAVIYIIVRKKQKA